MLPANAKKHANKKLIQNLQTISDVFYSQTSNNKTVLVTLNTPHISKTYNTVFTKRNNTLKLCIKQRNRSIQ